MQISPEVSTLDFEHGSFHPVPEAEAAFSTPF